MVNRRKYYEIEIVNMDDEAGNSISSHLFDTAYTKESAIKKCNKILKRIIKNNEDVNSNVFYVNILEYTWKEEEGCCTYECGIDWDCASDFYTRLNKEGKWEKLKFK